MKGPLILHLKILETKIVIEIVILLRHLWQNYYSKTELIIACVFFYIINISYDLYFKLSNSI